MTARVRYPRQVSSRTTPNRVARRLACILPLLFGCQEADRPQAIDGDPNALVAAIMRSPCDSDLTGMSEPIAIALTGRPPTAMEVHDCERLVVNNRYGPLVAIHPIARAMEGEDSHFAGWTPVASVMNWGPGAYPPLRLDSGSHCLFLRKAGADWQAHLSFAQNCPTQQLGDGEQPNLAVVSQTYSGPDTALPDRPIYPPTARFRWHTGNRQHYMGIKCGDNWCSVGDTTSLPSASPIEGALIANMPGYFDEQPMPLANAGVVRVGPVARIQPTDSLRIALQDPDLRDSFITYAVVEILPAGSSPGDIRLLELAMSLGEHPSSKARGARLVLNVDDEYVAARRYGAPPHSQELEFGFLEGQQHAAPGTVRWRWRDVSRTAAPDSSRSDTALGADPQLDSLTAAALAGYSARAAAWIPCQTDNCCTAVW